MAYALTAVNGEPIEGVVTLPAGGARSEVVIDFVRATGAINVRASGGSFSGLISHECTEIDPEGLVTPLTAAWILLGMYVGEGSPVTPEGRALLDRIRRSLEIAEAQG